MSISIETQKTYRRNLRALAVFAAACFALLVVVNNQPESVDFDLGTSAKVGGMMEDRPNAEGSAAQAIEGHRCANLPSGTIPAHVVVRASGSDRFAYTANAAVVHAAFEQLVFDGVLDANEFTHAVDHDMDVAALCA